MSDAVVGILLSYLQLSVLIALGFALFRGVRWLAVRVGLRVGSAGMSRIARVVFVATVLSPVAVHLLLSAPIPDVLQWVPSDAPAISADALAAELADAPRLVAERLIPGGGENVWSFLRGLEPWQVELAVALVAAFLLSGFAVGATRTAARLSELRDVVRAAAPLRRVGRVSIVVSDRARVPFSTTIFGRAHVVVPVGLLHDAAVLRVVVRHELQHYRRSDPVWAIALEPFRLLFFWHPAAHAWVRQLSDLQELACDEALVRRGVSAREYGTCLLHVAEMAVMRRMVASTAMATASDRGAHLRRRIDMLFQYDRNNDSRRSWAVLSMVAVVMILATAWVAAATWPTPADLATSHASFVVPENGELVARIETLALANGASVDTVVARGPLRDMAPGLDIGVTASLDDFDAFMESVSMEGGVVLAGLTLNKTERWGAAREIRATLQLETLDDSVSWNAPVVVAASDLTRPGVIAQSLDLFGREDISDLELELGGGSVTVFVKNKDGACSTDLAGVFGDRPELLPDTAAVLADGYTGDFDRSALGEWREVPDLGFETASGSAVHLSSLRGKVVLVDFWASWCRPCVDELPVLKILDRELGGADFEIVGVSLDTESETFEKFVEDNGIQWPQRHEADGWNSAAARAFEVTGLPSHYVVDRDGRFVQIPVGNPELLARTVAAMVNQR